MMSLSSDIWARANEANLNKEQTENWHFVLTTAQVTTQPSQTFNMVALGPHHLQNEPGPSAFSKYLLIYKEDT